MSISRLESLTLEIAQADHVGSLESASSGYGEESAFKVRDAELTGFDLKIKENTGLGSSYLFAGIESLGLDRETMGLDDRRARYGLGEGLYGLFVGL